MKKAKYAAPRKWPKVVLCILIMAVCLGALFLLGRELLPQVMDSVEETTVTTAPTETTEPTQTLPPETTEPPLVWETGFIATLEQGAIYYNEYGVSLGTIPRGTQVEYARAPENETLVRYNGVEGYLQVKAQLVSALADSVPAHTLYVRTTVNLQDAEGKLLGVLAEKGSPVEVTGCDYVLEDGNAHMYRVSYNGEEGYIRPWYLTGNQADALAVYDNGEYVTHAGRENRYGGGGAADLDYFPREKGPIDGNVMPEECRTLYIVTWQLDEVDAYLRIANDSGINAFVVDIVDGEAVGYAGEVMKAYSPSAARAALNTVEAYQAAIQKLKDAGYYVIGRITTFNDAHYVSDHPEHAITNTGGQPMKLSATYWPTPYNRAVWQYKVDLAVEAVKLMGFHEIQFDYVRFPDRTMRYEEEGSIDFHNTYGESKAQAIQRFLMYATDVLHEQGAYVSADVYGESAFTYVTAYGQYWPAISNVVDVISGMPYPDHFAASGSWRPWEHPYDIIHKWGESVALRQEETTTPAAVRTWIQAYNAIREPYNTYGPDEVFAQIKALRDTGCTGGYMTWNSGASIEKYTRLKPAFTPPEEEVPETAGP